MVSGECLRMVSEAQEEISCLSLNKEDAWKDFGAKLKDMGNLIKDPGCRHLLEICSVAMEKGFHKLSTSGRMSVVESVSGILEEIRAAIDHDKRPEVDTYLENLKNLIPECGDILPPQAVDLNQIADLIVRTEPDDREGIKKLSDLIASFLETMELPEELRGNWVKIQKELEAASGEGPEQVSSALKKLEVLVDETSMFGPTDTKEKISVAQGTQPQEKIYEEEDFQLPKDSEVELLSDFVSEGADLISTAEEALLALEADPSDMEAVSKVFRAFHTIKGTSAFLGLTPISEMAHKAENLLSRVREGEIRYEGGYADLCLRALDMIKELVRGVGEGITGKTIKKPEGFDELLEILKDPEGHGISETMGLFEEPVPRIGDLLVAKGVIGREEVDAFAKVVDGKPLGKRLVDYGLVDAKDVAEALRTQRKLKSEPEVEISVRVSTQRLDRLIDMVGELVIAHSMVAQDAFVLGSQNHELQKKVAHTSKIVRELQDLSMSMRMVPLKATFNKMQRLVRDLSKKVGKKVQLITEGDETEIDRNMVDVINDPLVHMIRNAIDHGIETPSERIAKGKPEKGTILLSAYHSSGNVVVEISDDGKGLDREAILKKAVEKGLVHEGALLSEKEIFNLIFEPGFSTAKVVTDVSGRGVGMDVVKRNIEKLRGQVEVHSRPGQGSTFKISLPLTLAIIDGMVVKVGKERYVIPTGSIVRAVKPKEEELSTVLKSGNMIRLQDELLPVFRLADLFQIESDRLELKDALAVIIQDESHKIALLVDELIGRQQIVIKSLGEALKNIPAISGGAIMPDGGVGLILDVGGILRLANS